MAYLIDTNILSELRKKQRADIGVTSWFGSVDGSDCYISVLTLGEINNGINRLRVKDFASAQSLQFWMDGLVTNFSNRILYVTPQIAMKWGEITAPNPLPVVDSLLAATAIIHNLTLVTRNIKDVKSSGARLLNPFQNQ